MKTYQAIAPGKGAFCDCPTPTPTGDQVLARVCYCGICGTDYALFSGNSSFIRNRQATYPIRLGHEWSGVVAAVGPAVTRLRVGDRVVGDNYVSCGECPACLRKDYNFCTGRHHVGTIDPCWPGAFAEYFLAPERHVYRLGDNISLREAALCEPLSVAWGGVKKMNVTGDSVVAVIGTGSIGMAAAALARYRGAGSVYLIGRNRWKLERALQLGITGTICSEDGDAEAQLLALTGGRHADFVVECSGNPDTVSEALSLTAQKATVALIGFYEKKLDGLDIDRLVSHEVTLVGIMGEYGNLEAVSKIMAETDLHLSGLITDEVAFADCDAAFHPADRRRVIKTLVTIGEE